MTEATDEFFGNPPRPPRSLSLARGVVGYAMANIIIKVNESFG